MIFSYHILTDLLIKDSIIPNAYDRKHNQLSITIIEKLVIKIYKAQ